jgi:hypothetical protein
VRTLIAALLLGAASPAFADAAAAFRDGQWPVAVKAGRAEATVDSLILAGRAQLALAAYSTRNKARAIEMIGAAEKDIDAALAKAPANVEAQLQKAVVVGYHAKLTRSPGLAKESRRRFEAVRAAHPDSALAWSGIAGWHGGAVATLGGFMASMAMGAKAAEVDPGFRQAIKLDPTNPIHRTVYAMTLLDLDSKNAAKAAAVLQGIGQVPANDAYEAFVRAQGVQLLAAVQAGDAGAAQTLARRLQAFGTLG